jgi:hypothetical protein
MQTSDFRGTKPHAVFAADIEEFTSIDPADEADLVDCFGLPDLTSLPLTVRA